MQYVGRHFTPLNLRMNINMRENSRCEVPIDHYNDVCKTVTFSIKVIEKVLGNGYENRIKDNAMLEYRFQREDYWMKHFVLSTLMA